MIYKHSIIFFLIAFALLLSSKSPATNTHAQKNLFIANQLGPDLINYYTDHPDYFDFDLQKYRMHSQEIIGKSLQSSLPIGIGALLFSLMGNPIAIVPVSIGVLTGAKAIKHYIQNRNTKRVLKGAYLYLQPEYTKSLKKARKYQSYFDKFHQKTKIFPDKTDKKQIALTLLYINHYAPLIARRLQSDPELASYQYFYKKNKVPQDGSWNQNFMTKYFNLLEKTLIDTAKHNSFQQLNRIQYGNSVTCSRSQT